MKDDQARSLKSLNLSDTVWDKKGIEYLVQALNVNHAEAHSPKPSTGNQEGDTSIHKILPIREHQGETVDNSSYGSFILPAPLLKQADEVDMPAAIQTLRMDACGFRATTLEPLGAFAWFSVTVSLVLTFGLS